MSNQEMADRLKNILHTKANLGMGVDIDEDIDIYGDGYGKEKNPWIKHVERYRRAYEKKFGREISYKLALEKARRTYKPPARIVRRPKPHPLKQTDRNKRCPEGKRLYKTQKGVYRCVGPRGKRRKKAEEVIIVQQKRVAKRSKPRAIKQSRRTKICPEGKKLYITKKGVYRCQGPRGKYKKRRRARGRGIDEDDDIEYISID